MIVGKLQISMQSSHFHRTGSLSFAPTSRSYNLGTASEFEGTYLISLIVLVNLSTEL